MRSTEQIDAALRFRFGLGLVAQGNRFASKLTKRFMSLAEVERIFATLTPPEAKLADTMLSEICGKLGYMRQWKRLTAILDKALDEADKCARTILGKIHEMVDRGIRERPAEMVEEAIYEFPRVQEGVYA